MIFTGYFEDVVRQEGLVIVPVSDGLKGPCIRELCPTMKERCEYKKNKKKYGSDAASVLFGQEYKERIGKIGFGTLIGKICEKSGVNDALKSNQKTVILTESKWDEPLVGKYLSEFFHTGGMELKEWRKKDEY